MILKGKEFFLTCRTRGALWRQGISVTSMYSPASGLVAPVLLKKRKLEKFFGTTSREILEQCHYEASTFNVPMCTPERVICDTGTGINISTTMGPQPMTL